MTAYAQSLTGEYRGSRMKKARYMYENTVHANFIELSADARLEPDQFRELLENVEGVREVALHRTSKEEQGNFGAQDPTRRSPRRGHYQAQNFMVFSTLFPNDCRGMEFELTESLHMRKVGLPLTISACYKSQGSLHKSLEAWRILRAAVSGKELDSNVVSKFEEELKAFINSSIEKPTVFFGFFQNALASSPANSGTGRSPTPQCRTRLRCKLVFWSQPSARLCQLFYTSAASSSTFQSTFQSCQLCHTTAVCSPAVLRTCDDRTASASN